MNAEETSTVVEIGRAPIILEVHTERLIHLMGALVGGEFAIKRVPGRINRFMILDKVEREPKRPAG